jgi:hypothetical protein
MLSQNALEISRAGPLDPIAPDYPTLPSPPSPLSTLSSYTGSSRLWNGTCMVEVSSASKKDVVFRLDPGKREIDFKIERT